MIEEKIDFFSKSFKIHHQSMFLTFLDKFSPSPKPKRRECDICYDLQECKNFFTFHPCKHRMCDTCYWQYDRLICHMCRGKVKYALKTLVKN